LSSEAVSPTRRCGSAFPLGAYFSNMIIDLPFILIIGIPIIIILLGIMTTIILFTQRKYRNYSRIIFIIVIIIGLLGYLFIIISNIVDSIMLHPISCCEYSLSNMTFDNLRPLYELLFFGVYIDIFIIALGFLFVYSIGLPIILIKKMMFRK
jgi:hypothetical protein